MCVQKRVRICQKLQLCLLIDKIYLPVRYYKFILCVCVWRVGRLCCILFISFSLGSFMFIFILLFWFLLGKGVQRNKKFNLNVEFAWVLSLHSWSFLTAVILRSFWRIHNLYGQLGMGERNENGEHVLVLRRKNN